MYIKPTLSRAGALAKETDQYAQLIDNIVYMVKEIMNIIFKLFELLPVFGGRDAVEALEKAVVHLVVKGGKVGLPGFKPAKDEDIKFFKEYMLDTDEIEREKMEKLIQKTEEETKESEEDQRSAGGRGRMVGRR